MNQKFRYSLLWLLLGTALTVNLDVVAATEDVRPPGNASCLVETRKGETSCWEITIHLDKDRFKSTIRRAQIRVEEFKYGRDITSLMEWKVSPAGETLTLRFKNGFGDFGTGNEAFISIARTAFLKSSTDLPVWVRWSVDTDRSPNSKLQTDR